MDAVRRTGAKRSDLRRTEPSSISNTSGLDPATQRRQRPARPRTNPRYMFGCSRLEALPASRSERRGPQQLALARQTSQFHFREPVRRLRPDHEFVVSGAASNSLANWGPRANSEVHSNFEKS